ncbi:FtsX-like permease family protein [Catenulispora pinisilvae]|uniref:FtsX-like permease family protein n=1 Tax=Catenulispora pinisilvae TaxID=2705253 RepID=UPI001E4BC147|nr:FtsX-like permease family protein [Catenulispora pinisilvae]
MLTIALRNLTARRRRLIGTFLAVFLGVAFLAGTLTLNATLSRNFSNLFATADTGVSAVVQSDTLISTSGGAAFGGLRAPVSSQLADTIRKVPGVADAQPEIVGYGQLLGADGKAVGGNGPPRTAGNWIPSAALNPYRLLDGRAPRDVPAGQPVEAVINRGAAESGQLKIGDTTIVQTPLPVRITIVGIAGFGTQNGIGEVTYAGFTQAVAQKYIARPGQASEILIAAQPGVSQGSVVAAVSKTLPPGLSAISGAQYTKATTAAIGTAFLTFFKGFLLVFAAVALLVAAFSIHNTYTILIAQRTRENALLRALGASRGQVLGSSLAEAAALGQAASAVGVVGGLGIAQALKALFDVAGFALPAGGLAVTRTTIALALVVGVGVTALAALSPAVRASRVAPLAALREASVGETRSGFSRVRSPIGGVLLAGGVVSAIAGGSLAVVGAGAAATTVGVLMLGPVAARGAVRVLGSVVTVGGRLAGTTGVLARRNAARDPRRTSATATALMVGVAVVTLLTVFATSVKASLKSDVDRSFVGDLAVSAPAFGGGGLSPQLAVDLQKVPGVQAAVGIGQGTASVAGSATNLTFADTGKLNETMSLDVRGGSVATLAGGRAIGVSASEAKKHPLGSAVPVVFPDGTTSTIPVGFVYGPRGSFDGYLIDAAAWSAHANQVTDSSVIMKLAPGTSVAAARPAVTAAMVPYGSPDVQDRQQYADSQASGVDVVLTISYVLLVLAIVIALAGIANTLALSVHERTRELGLLRAVGLTRRQTRALVRWESLLVALFGTLGGVALGTFLAWALVRAAGSSTAIGFAVSPGALALILGAGAVAGVAAATRPASRAARLDLLGAIATE